MAKCIASYAKEGKGKAAFAIYIAAKDVLLLTRQRALV